MTGDISNACKSHSCRKAGCKIYPGDDNVYCSDHTCKYVKQYDYYYGYSRQYCKQISIEGYNHCISHKCNIKSCDSIKDNDFYCEKHKCTEKYCLQTQYKNYVSCLTHSLPNTLSWIFYQHSGYGKTMISDINDIIKQYVIFSG
jgi:hypothetical protein